MKKVDRVTFCVIGYKKINASQGLKNKRELRNYEQRVKWLLLSLWLLSHFRILKYISLSPELTKFHLAERHQHQKKQLNSAKTRGVEWVVKNLTDKRQTKYLANIQFFPFFLSFVKILQDLPSLAPLNSQSGFKNTAVQQPQKTKMLEFHSIGRAHTLGFPVVNFFSITMLLIYFIFTYKL